MELGKLHLVGFPARDDDDTTTRLLAVRVKGHVQEMESLGLDDQLDDYRVRKGKRVCSCFLL